MLAITSAASDQRRGPLPEALADQRQQPLAGDDPEPHPDLVEDDQRRGREGEDPEQLVAVAGAEDRVGGDPGRVVVGEAGEDAGADHRQQRRDAAGAQQAVAAPGSRQWMWRPGVRCARCRWRWCSTVVHTLTPRRDRLAAYISVGGQGKSGANPAWSRHCDRVEEVAGASRVSHWGRHLVPGKARPP